MGYITRSLGPNEKIIYRAHFNWLWRARGWIVLLVMLAIAAVAYQQHDHWAATIISAAGVVAFVLVMLPIWTKEVAITNERLIYKRGIIARDTNEIQLRAVEEVALDQGIFGRIFRYGQISVHGTGGEDMRLPTLGEPVTLRQNLQKAMAQVGRFSHGGKTVP